jgi:hypothetical protein
VAEFPPEVQGLRELRFESPEGQIITLTISSVQVDGPTPQKGMGSSSALDA